MADIPTSEPLSVYAGDTVRWTRSFTDYPANDGWTLTYSFTSSSSRFTVDAVADAALHLVNVAAATTASWRAGDYTWRAQAKKGAEAFTVGTGRMRVQGTASASTSDRRTFARATLDAVETYMRDPANMAAAEYEIAGRRLKRYELADLLALRDRMRAEVAREEAAERLEAGLPDGRRVFVRWGA
jgi:hypothetical protein